MAESITPQDLENVKEDIEDIGQSSNERMIINPRYGAPYKSIPLLSDELQDAIETAAAAGAGSNGWTDLLVLTADGSTQRAKNASLQSQVNDKANKTYVDSQDASLQSQIDQKASAAYLDVALDEQTQTVNTALSQLSTAATKFYPTLAEANADIANIAINQPVQVGEAGANGGLHYKATTEATTLTKSPYDPLTQAKTQTEEYVADEALNLFAKLIDLGYSNNMTVRRYTAASTFNDYAAGMYQTLVAGKVQLSVTASGSNGIKHFFNTAIGARNFQAEFTVNHQQFAGDAIGVGFKNGDNNEIIAFSNSGNLNRISNYTNTVLQSGLGTYGVGDKVKFVYSNSKISVYLNNVLKGEASITESGTIIVGQMGFSHYLSELGGGEIDPIRDYVKEQIAGASFQKMSVGYYAYDASSQTFFAYTQVKGNLYVGFEVKHEVDMRDLIYQDYWRIFQALFYTFDGEAMQPTGKVALGTGESEFVFKQVSAKDDFTGGYHGDEIATSIKLMADGLLISTVSSIPLTSANKLEYIVQSTMHETAEGGVFVPEHPVIAYHTKHTEFKGGGYKTRNLVDWNYAGTLSTLYHGISCIHKDVASVVFTDKDYTDQAMTGSGNNYFNAIGARLYKGRNPTNGLAVEAAAYQQKVDGADALSELFVHDRSTDSKYYRKSPAKTVSIGEKHESYFECCFLSN